jgi:hypothetical protein
MHLLGMRALHCWAAATPFLHVQGMPSITRVSQLTPMTPTGHVQVYVPASLLHMPPFWHGALMQASMPPPLPCSPSSPAGTPKLLHVATARATYRRTHHIHEKANGYKSILGSG